MASLMSDHSSAVDVVLCRGCCCGTQRKHPDFDHALQGLELREAAEKTGGKLRYSNCLGPCEHSNVAVVKQPEKQALWFGGLLSTDLTDELARWITGQGTLPLPDSLKAQRIPAGRGEISPPAQDAALLPVEVTQIITMDTP